MDRRLFLKILGASSFAIALPPGVEYLIKQIERNNYDEDLLRQMFGDILNNISPQEFKWLHNLKEEYTLYRINGKRVQISKDTNRKDVRDRWARGNVEVLDSSKNVFDASIRAAQYNKQLGVGLTGRYAQSYGQPYFWVRVRQYRFANNPAAQLRRKQNYDWEGVSRKTSSLSKGSILKMKEQYKSNLSLSAADLGSMYGISTLAAIQYLTNKKKVNFGDPIEIRKESSKKCPHCKKVVTGAGLGNYNRWHGDNCKKAPNYTKPVHIIQDNHPKWKELSSGFVGTYYEMRNKFPFINMPSMMNSDRNNKPLEKGKSKGLQFVKLTTALV